MLTPSERKVTTERKRERRKKNWLIVDIKFRDSACNHSDQMLMCYSQPGLGVGVGKMTIVSYTQTHEVKENVRLMSTKKITAFGRKVAGLVTCRGIRNIDSAIQYLRRRTAIHL